VKSKPLILNNLRQSQKKGKKPWNQPTKLKNHHNRKPNQPKRKSKAICPESTLLVMYKTNINISHTAIEIAGLNISNILYCTKHNVFCTKNILLFHIWKVNVLDIGTNSSRSERVLSLRGQSLWSLYTTLGNTLYVDK